MTDSEATGMEQTVELPGVTIISLEEQVSRVSHFAIKPWQRDPAFRSANPFGKDILDEKSVGLYNVIDNYLVAYYYADWRTGQPFPSYGYYEDNQRRLVFQHVEPMRGLVLIGRCDIAVQDRPPTMDVRGYLERFQRYLLPPLDPRDQDDGVVRERIKFAVSQMNWPFGDGPQVVRDASPGQIIQSEDKPGRRSGHE